MAVSSQMSAAPKLRSRRVQQHTVKENVYFIGGHPMAGSERHGVEAAISHLFENAFYVLTPAEGTPQAEVDRLTESA